MPSTETMVHMDSCCFCYSQKSKSQVWKSLIAAFSLYIKEVREGKGRGYESLELGKALKKGVKRGKEPREADVQ